MRKTKNEAFTLVLAAFALTFGALTASPPTQAQAVYVQSNDSGDIGSRVPAGVRAERPNRAAFEAAATACGLTKPERGQRPPELTSEQQTCMTNAGFPKPPHGRHHHRDNSGDDDGQRPPPPEFEQGSGRSSQGTVQ